MLGLWIGTGGALGAIARFAIGGWVTTWAYVGFPWATFAINVTGSFLLGFLYRALPRSRVPPHVAGFLTVGFCGGFTTFSTFGFEMLALLEVGEIATAVLYAVASVVLSVSGVLAGMRVGTPRRGQRRPAQPRLNEPG